MARSYANVLTAIWRDEDFRELSAAAQRTYLMLVTQPNISAAGTLPLTLVRWASHAKDTTPASLRADLAELEATRFVFVDEVTEEVLVRSFVRHDNGYRNPKRKHAIVGAAGEMASPVLRAALEVEFDRLGLSGRSGSGEPQPLRPKRTEAAESTSPIDLPVDNLSAQVNSLSMAIPEDADSPPDSHASSEWVVVTQGPYVGPQPSTRNPQSAPPRRALDPPARFVADTLGCDDDDAQWIADEVNRRHTPKKLIGYLRRMAGEGDLAAMLSERHPPPRSGPTLDPPCGGCGPNRLVECDDGRMTRCPICHPLREERVA
jgi:hypothetical protein